MSERRDHLAAAWGATLVLLPLLAGLPGGAFVAIGGIGALVLLDRGRASLVLGNPIALAASALALLYVFLALAHGTFLAFARPMQVILGTWILVVTMNLAARPAGARSTILAGSWGLGGLALAELARLASGGSVHEETIVLGMNPNSLARVALVFLVAAMFGAVRLTPLERLAASTVAGSAVVLTGSRGAILGAVAAIGIGLATDDRVSRRLALLPLSVCAGLAFFLARGLESLDLADSTGSKSSRADYLEVAGQAFLDHPILGVGPGCSLAGGSRCEPPVLSDLSFPHNIALELAAEAGMVGALISIVLVFTLRRATRPWQLVCLAAFVSGLTSGNLGTLWPLWMAIGAAAGSLRWPDVRVWSFSTVDHPEVART